MKKRIFALLMAAVMLMSFAACGNTKTATDAKTQLDAETTAPVVAGNDVFGEFTSLDMDGNEVDYTVFEGKKVTMVAIWATFCSACISGMTDLERLHNDYADKGFQIVGMVCDVTGDEKKAEAQAIIEKAGVTYLNILPSESLDDAKLESVYQIPEFVFLDEHGNQIGQSYIGSRSYEEWATIIQQFLGE